MKHILLLLCFGMATMVGATEPTAMTEIRHLVAYVRGSDVVFIRNGQEHKPDQAAEHLEKKYEHFKDEIATAEDFIRLAATRSLMSGKPYRIRQPNGETEEAAKWLTRELDKFRSENRANGR